MKIYIEKHISQDSFLLTAFFLAFSHQGFSFSFWNIKNWRIFARNWQN
jgi:hypothetical protein